MGMAGSVPRAYSVLIWVLLPRAELLLLAEPPHSRNLDRVVETSPAETTTSSFLPGVSCDSEHILPHSLKRQRVDARDTRAERNKETTI